MVLGPEIIKDIEADSNIRVFDAADLLQDFLRTLQNTCRTAAKLNQPVLLMTFGHGDPITYGVAIGGRGSRINASRLHINHFFFLKYYVYMQPSGLWQTLSRL